MEATIGPFAAGTYHLTLYQQWRQNDGSLGAPVFDTALDFPVQADPPPCTPASIVVEPAFAVAAPGAAFPSLTVRVVNIEGRPLPGIPLYWGRNFAPGERYDDPLPDAHFDATQAQSDSAGEVKIAATANALSGAATYSVYYWGRNSLISSFVLANSSASGEIAPVVEYASASDPDHYFLTSEVAEMHALDRGLMGAWYRTGAAFLGWPSPALAAGLVDVCRFYGSMSPGPNSHFYTASEAECAMLIAQSSATPLDRARWNYEGRAFAAKLPVGGVCSGDAPTPLYRLYNDGFARGQPPHHRYTTSPSVAAQMQEYGGWKAEGIAMCLR
ncbi:MAG: hypothetical protein F9K47_10730 [Burkholderiales bacterium]|nr:MAG: hypothetical protein F9K47_10730 [Burkholderiales bacterium]